MATFEIHLYRNVEPSRGLESSKMKVDDEFISEDEFATIIEKVPQVCVEVVLKTADGILLVQRQNEPAMGEWFWPGSRVYKGERLESAAHRVASEELGIEITIISQLGVHAHFWETSSVKRSPSRHTVNIVYLAEPVHDPPDISLDDQHSKYRYLSELEPHLHEYVSLYLEEYDLI